MSKNSLQEYFQKRNLPLPQYITLRCGGTDTIPEFFSTVILHDKSKFKGDIAYNKKDAESLAAKESLDQILKSNEIKNIKIKEKTVILVDLENVPQMLELNNVNLEGITVKYFIGKLHALIPKLKSQYNEKLSNVHIVDSCAKDAVDNAIVFYSGILVGRNKKLNFIIVTRDHFADSLTVLLKEKNMGKVEHVTNYDDCMSILEKWSKD